MSTAIFIVTHGRAAEHLLETTEMLIGKQENVATLEFLPGESADFLITKYEQKISTELSESKEVLFLVDAWGGSPFNAANRYAQDKENIEVIAGVNIPMLVETCLSREDGLSLSELAKVAVNAGIEGVKALKTKVTEAKAIVKPAQPTVAETNKEGNLNIVFARIDDRLIHGQVAMRWTKETGVTRIIVVNDGVAKDTVRAPMLKAAAPAGVSAHVVSVDKMIRVYNNPEYANERVMLLFTNPSDVLSLVKAGIPLSKLNVGGMSFNEGRTMLNSYVSVNETDVKAFNELEALNVAIDVRKVSDDPMISINDLLKKHNFS